MQPLPLEGELTKLLVLRALEVEVEGKGVLVSSYTMLLDRKRDIEAFKEIKVVRLAEPSRIGMSVEQLSSLRQMDSDKDDKVYCAPRHKCPPPVTFERYEICERNR